MFFIYFYFAFFTNLDLLQDPAVLASQSNDILTAVVQGARKEEPK